MSRSNSMVADSHEGLPNELLLRQDSSVPNPQSMKELEQEQRSRKTRTTLSVTQTDLSFEIEKYEQQHKRMVPKVTKICQVPRTGLAKIFLKPIPTFTIQTNTLNDEESWVINRSYKDFEVLRQYMLE